MGLSEGTLINLGFQGTFVVVRLTKHAESADPLRQLYIDLADRSPEYLTWPRLSEEPV